MSLAIAAHSLSEALEEVLKPVHVVVDTPSATAEMVKSNTAEDFLNIFLYRVAPSGVHAAQASNQPFFLRLFALLTPFARREVAGGGPGNGNGNGGGGAAASGPADYPDLQILTDVLRHFHENPVSDIMHADAGGAGTAYRIHAIPQAPEMEELNHIWTTQNNTLGYRLSAVFEFTLIPIDPVDVAQPETPVRSAIAQVAPNLDRKDETPTGYDAEFSTFPGLGPQDADIWDGPVRLPQVLAHSGDELTSKLDVTPTATALSLRLAGPVDFTATITTTYMDAEGLALSQTTLQRTIDALSLNDPSAAFSLALAIPGGTKKIVIDVRAANPDGSALALDRIGTTVTATVTGGA